MLELILKLLNLVFKKQQVGEASMPENEIIQKLTPELLKKELFIFTPLSNIKQTLPLLLTAMEKRNLLNKEVVCYAIATLYVENDKFIPLAESPSKWSTKNGKAPFDFSNYIGKGGNKDINDASLYRGSGLIQLTLKQNYELYDNLLNLNGKLIKEGYKYGNDPKIAADIFAEYLKQHETQIYAALKTKDSFIDDRQIVNGPKALHWDKHEQAYKKLITVIN